MDNYLNGAETERLVLKLAEMRERILKVQEDTTSEKKFVNDLITNVEECLKKLLESSRTIVNTTEIDDTVVQSEREKNQDIHVDDKETAKIIARLKQDLKFVSENRIAKSDIDLKMMVKGFTENLNAMLRKMYPGERPADIEHEKTEGNCTDNPRLFYNIGCEVHLLAESDVSNIIQATQANSEDLRDSFMNDTNLKNYQLETDFFNIEAKDPKHKEIFPKDSTGMITVMVQLPNDINYHFLHLKACIKVGKSWHLVKALLKEKTVTFQTVKIDAFCIVSTPKVEQIHISPDGYTFVAQADERVQINFLPGTVENEGLISLRVAPVNKQILQRKYDERNKDGESILAITDCLRISGDKQFKKKVQVTLPLNDVKNSDESDEKYECKFFRQNTNGQFTLTETEVKVDENNSAVFETDKISGTVALIGINELKKGSQVISGNLEEMHGFKFICKVVFFVSGVTPSGLTALLACIEQSKMQSFCHTCEEMGFRLYKNWTSRDLELKPQTKINIKLKGSFIWPRCMTRKRLDLTFLQNSTGNFTRFRVDIKPKIDQHVCGILVLTKGTDVVDEIFYDPQNAKEYTHVSSFKGRRTPDQGTGQPVKKTVSRGKSFICRKPTSTGCQYSENDFLTDKGVMAVAKLLNTNKMFETVLNLDMKKVQYDQICENVLIGSMQAFTLLKTGIDLHKSNKIDKLVSALESAEERGLADSIRELYKKRQDLSTIQK